MLIIYAHPNKEGHCGYILEKITEDLKAKGVGHQLLDLYTMNYDPVLKPEEHYTSGKTRVSEQNLQIQEMIKKEDRFVIIYPTWWNSAPAILKGFVDRVFVARFAFYYDKGLPKKILSGKAAVITTTGGPRIITKFFYKDGSKNFLVRDVLGFCGIKAKGFVIDNAKRLSDRQKNKIEKTVRRALAHLL